MTVPRLSDTEYSALAEFRHRLRRFLAFSEEQARSAGLNPQQHQLLLALRGFGAEAPSVGELAERLVLKHHSAVELVDRLERQKMVARQRSASDRRLARVSLTARGARLLQGLTLAHREELQRTGPDLARALVSLLRQGRVRSSASKAAVKPRARSKPGKRAVRTATTARSAA
jgi:DNA-binding MarR family transcriptional regulator